jgi:hypothetical protein
VIFVLLGAARSIKAKQRTPLGAQALILDLIYDFKKLYFITSSKEILNVMAGSSSSWFTSTTNY